MNLGLVVKYTEVIIIHQNYSLYFLLSKVKYSFSCNTQYVRWNPVNTDTKGTCKNVRIIGVSVLSGFPEKSHGHMFYR